MKGGKPFGWREKILKVDLGSSSIREEDLPQDLATNYIGGSGLNARLFYDLMREHPFVDPLSPDNPLIFGFGPAVGTFFPCATRFTVTAKSPLTGIFSDSKA
jgi:aldehyde:ferredoxin oxidoreductase